MRDCKQDQVLADTIGSYPGIGEEEVGMEKQVEGEVSSNQMKRSFAQVLREENYKFFDRKSRNRRKQLRSMSSRERRKLPWLLNRERNELLSTKSWI